MIHTLTSKSYRIAVGFALFAMFFGSGNLIFPLSIGFFSQDLWSLGALGFLLTGVVLPFLGIITMVSYEGDYEKFFSILGKWGSFLFAFALLSAWIPLGSGPRCVVLSFVNIQSYIFDAPLWLYSLIYCVLLYVIAIKKSSALDLVGYVLTPLLLFCLAAVIYLGFQSSPGVQEATIPPGKIFTLSLLEGYQTQDLIASFFFASTVIDILRSNKKEGVSPVKAAFQASIIGIFLLGIVYVGLILLAASSGNVLSGVAKEAYLATLVATFLPPKLAFIGSMAVVLACFTTSIALTMVFADFLHKHFFSKNNSNRIPLLITVGITFLFSLTGFEMISAVMSPLMQIFYPFLIVLIVWNIFANCYNKKKNKVKNLSI